MIKSVCDHCCSICCLVWFFLAIDSGVLVSLWHWLMSLCASSVTANVTDDGEEINKNWWFPTAQVYADYGAGSSCLLLLTNLQLTLNKMSVSAALRSVCVCLCACFHAAAAHRLLRCFFYCIRSRFLRESKCCLLCYLFRIHSNNACS